jgi:hypothetical protein
VKEMKNNVLIVIGFITTLFFLKIIHFNKRMMMKDKNENPIPLKENMSSDYDVNEQDEKDDEDYITKIVKRNNLKLANDYEYKFILNPGKKVCYHPDEDINLLALVPIRVNGFDKRNFIRTTWKNNDKIRLLFLTGQSKHDRINKKLKYESKLYNDIIQQDFRDTYLNLTLKTMMGLEWASKYCNHAEFVLKVDEDVAVNVDKLLNFLKNTESKLNTFYGVITKSYRVSRYDENYPVTYEEYADEWFPNYCAGSSYLLTGDLVSKMYKLSKYVKKFCIEDIYSGLLGKYLKAKMISINYITITKNTIYRHKILINGLNVSNYLFFWSKNVDELVFAQKKMNFAKVKDDLKEN